MRFLNYGSVNIDLIFMVDHIVKGGETLQSTSLTKSAGGKGANQSAALAKAGAEVFHAGKVAGKTLARCARHNILPRLVGNDDVFDFCEILGVAEAGSSEFDCLDGHLVFLLFLS